MKTRELSKLLYINNIRLILRAENARTQLSTDRNFAVWLPKRATMRYYSRRLCNVLLHPKSPSCLIDSDSSQVSDRLYFAILYTLSWYNPYGTIIIGDVIFGVH